MREKLSAFFGKIFEKFSAFFEKKFGENDNFSDFFISIKKFLKRTKILFKKFKKYVKWLAIFLFAAILCVILWRFFLKNFFKLEQKSTENQFLALDPETAQKTALQRGDDLDLLLKKADILYAKNDKKEALAAFKNIAIFSQTLADFNLGTLQMKQNEFALAQKSFEAALKNDENSPIVAFNAAMAAQHAGDPKNAARYLRLADENLKNAVNEKFYPYIFSLVKFHTGDYFSSLSGAENPVNPEFSDAANLINAKSFLAFNDNLAAQNYLLRMHNDQKDYKNLGLLYARTADFENAKLFLTKYQHQNPNDKDVLLALSLIYLKTSDFENASRSLKALGQNDQDLRAVKEKYPIKVVLRQSLFDVDIAQEDFLSDGISRAFYVPDRLLFYFAPLKVFDKNAALKTLQNSSIFAENFIKSPEILGSAAASAKIDEKIIEAIEKYAQNELDEALQILKTANENNPNHGILHYNLAVLYAQKDDFSHAFFHFLRAYHLDSSDVESAMFALLAASFTNENQEKITAIRNDILENLNAPNDRNFSLAFWRYVTGTFDAMSWLGETRTDENFSQNQSIFYALKAAHLLKFSQDPNRELLREIFSKLSVQNPGKFVPLALKELFFRGEKSFKNAANRLHKLFTNENFVLQNKDIFYGGALSKDLFAYLNFMTGTLRFAQNFAQKKLTATLKNPASILQTLALTNIYAQNFHQAYAIYDLLQQTYKIQDPRTLFLSAIASIGTGNYDHGALLLHLGKNQKNATENLEARLVLGMLYQQNGDFKSAANHYEHLVGKNFSSNFFDFVIDNEQILSALNGK